MSQPQVLERPCYKQHILVPRVQSALGVQLGEVACHVVSDQGMKNVMQKAGWRQAESRNVVGFQVNQKVYVLDGADWTTLHELVHRAGVNADRISRFVAEGLTEAIASDLAKGRDEHRPTYPKETTWVRNVLLPKLGMSAVQLGGLLARSADPPRTLADLLVARNPALDRAALVRQLAPQGGEQPSLNRMGKATRAPYGTQDSGSASVGGILVLSGFALLLPALFDRISFGRYP